MTRIRPRLDPFVDRARHMVAGGVRIRLDRTQSDGAQSDDKAVFDAAAVGAPAGRAPPLEITIDAAAGFILVVPDLEGGRLSLHDKQLLGAARGLADAASAAVMVLSPPGPPEFAFELGGVGADRIATLSGLASAWPEQRAASIAEAIRAIGPLHVLFPESPDGADLVRRVAVLTGAAIMADLEALSPLAAVRAARARQVEQSVPPPLLLSLQVGRALPYRGIPHAVREHDWNPPPPPPSAPAPPGTLDHAPVLRHGDPSSIRLTEASFVIAAGQGVTDFDRFRLLVSSLGATPGASRMVCDLGLLPRSWQVGASGSILEAACYVALGISGAPQHLQGVGRVEHVIAVNTDLHAAMVERAELAIIADAQAVSAALIEALAARA